MSTQVEPSKSRRVWPWENRPWLWRIGVVVVGIVAIALLPMILPADQLGIANIGIPAAIGALGLNLLTGYSGQVSMGHGAFLAVGAFSAVIVERLFHVNMWIGIPVAGIFTCIVGLLVGAPSLRFRGFYLVLTTLGLQFVVIYFLQLYQVAFGGGAGFSLAPQSFFGLPLNSDVSWFYVLLAFLVVVTAICWSLVHSDTGRAWVAVRDRDIAAAITGINVNRMKLKAFGASSFFAGIGGALTAYFIGFVSVESFTLALAIQYIAMIIVGGLGSIWGSILGALVISALPIWISGLVGLLPSGSPVLGALQSSVYFFQYAVYGLIIILVLILEPRGLVAVIPRLYRAIQHAVSGRAARSAAELVESASPAPDTASKVAVQRAARPGEELALEVNGLTVLYDGIERVLNNVSLHVRESQVVVVLGANGAGKTTLLRAISGFQAIEHAKIASGTVSQGSTVINRIPPDRIARRGIVHVPEREKVFRSLTVEQNLRLGMVGKSTKEDLDGVLELFPRLIERMASPAALLSGGERQMLALAVALLMRPKLLLLDELSLGLAPTVISSLYSTINTIRQTSRVSMLIVEQDATSALDYADYVYVLAHGDLVLSGTPAQLRDDPQLMEAYFGIGITDAKQTKSAQAVKS
jgi:branched-chain amino acid transport system permease protein